MLSIFKINSIARGRKTICHVHSEWFSARVVMTECVQHLMCINKHPLSTKSISYFNNSYDHHVSICRNNSLHLSLLLSTQYNWYVHPEEFCRCWHQVFGSKRVFQKDLEKRCMEVDWSKIHFTRARHLHRIWQAQIENENVPHVIYEDFAFLTTKTETENKFDRLSYPEH